jgi:16S rRNA (guanine527-N7)-methyltransferase
MSRDAEILNAIAALPGVSHETFERLKGYVTLLLQWQQRINLISPATIPEIWSRHVLDSLQLVALKPDARCWVDMGSGGGLPGLVIGCVMASYPGARVDLVESNGKKGAFLRHVATTLDLPVRVHIDRIEDSLDRLEMPEVVTARALASLDALLGFSNLLLKRGVIGLFPKGRDYQDELTAASKNWHFRAELHTSVTDSKARILEVTMV